MQTSELPHKVGIVLGYNRHEAFQNVVQIRTNLDRDAFNLLVEKAVSIFGDFDSWLENECEWSQDLVCELRHQGAPEDLIGELERQNLAYAESWHVDSESYKDVEPIGDSDYVETVLKIISTVSEEVFKFQLEDWYNYEIDLGGERLSSTRNRDQ
jgi:hypothetical protein